ncbi:VirB2 family type IV secretion system major pilin TrwL [Bartonella refiksaydamii]|uniref:VirB2 family type IV secretion system major pilin TrwL n=1 Tax=Bartonella refiksaydamii TaxID=2654951 RepID=UPI0012EC8B8B|nr:VirB2 family type IV secretion system major pilin TrwL [Bartonella refiksaydamii]
MKQLKTLLAISDKKNLITTIVVTLFFMAHPLRAQAQDLTKAKTALETFKTQLDIIIPIAAGVILLCLAIGYAGRYIEKGTFVRWAIGVVIAGSSAQIAKLLFTGN